ncbi:MAG: signal peptidase II [Deltaproteobacteria bacterium]|nr:signal peptidase II [Deltaproteobacteria bacterium]
MTTPTHDRSRRAAALVFLALALVTAGCDQAAKHIAREALGDGAVHEFLGGVARFQLAHNPGGFLSLGARLDPELRHAIFVFGAPALIALFLAVSYRAALASRLALAGLALVAGGGLANWADRLIHAGTVTDFVSLGVGALRTGIFNVADVAIMLGAALLLLPARQREEARDG